MSNAAQFSLILTGAFAMVSIGSGIIAWVEDDKAVKAFASRLQRGNFIAAAVMCCIALVLIVVAG